MMASILEKKELDLLCELTKEAAKAGGAIHRQYYTRDIQVDSKRKPYDLVSVADIESEKAIVGLIQKHHPEHNIHSEESGFDNKGSDFTWIIDPLDGTTNFVFGIPLFCSSIALVFGRQLVTSAVYDVLRDELFSASLNRGAYLNESPILVSETASLEESLLITGFFYDRGSAMRKNLETMRNFFEYPVRGIRRLGSAALDMCFVASGRATGFWEFCLNSWDFAAGTLIVQEAGGSVSNLDNNDVPLMEKSYVVASNSLIHKEMLNVLRMVDLK